MWHKVYWACDAFNSYPITGQIYLGKSVEGHEITQGKRVVKNLCYQFKNSGQNVTIDNFFTSLPLAQLLISWKLSMVGTLKKQIHSSRIIDSKGSSTNIVNVCIQ